MNAGFLLAALGLCALAVAIATAPLWRVARRSALALALGIPLAAGAMYALLGSPAALDPAQVRAPQTVEAAVAMLEQRLREDPDQAEGWILLGRSRMSLGQPDQAVAAFDRALALLPADADLMAAQAEALLAASPERRLPERGVRLLERALQIDPRQQRALFLLAMERLHGGQAAESVALFERLLPLVDADTANALRPQAERARGAAGLPPAQAAGGPRIDLTIELAPELQSRLAPGAALFVYARAADGAGPPVAAERLPIGEFPARLVLDDSDSPMPARRLSQLDAVILQARISQAGDAMPASGDFESRPLPLRLDGDALSATLTLDSVRP